MREAKDRTPQERGHWSLVSVLSSEELLEIQKGTFLEWRTVCSQLFLFPSILSPITTTATYTPPHLLSLQLKQYPHLQIKAKLELARIMRSVLVMGSSSAKFVLLLGLASVFMYGSVEAIANGRPWEEDSAIANGRPWEDYAFANGRPWKEDSAAARTITDLRVTHAVQPDFYTRPWEETLFDMFAKDNARFLYLASLASTKRTSVPIASGRQTTQTANYVVRVTLGTPPQTLLMAMDTSNDAAWVPCSGCVGCSSTVFDTTKSPEFQPLPCSAPQCRQLPNYPPTCSTPTTTCSFNLTYGTSTFSADLARDTLKLGPDAVPVYTFACLRKVTGTSVPPQGLLGLGRGPLSLLAQTDSLYHSTFSYCLPSIKSSNFSGSLRLGVSGQPLRIKTTPLLRNPRRSSLYYVNLVGIRVGRRVVDIPKTALAFDPATGAGTVIDSGTVFTRLVTPAYEAVRNEFRRRVNKPVTSLGGFDTCYSDPSIVYPTMTFMFAGMNVTLPPDNLLIHSSAGSTACLAMAAAPANVNSVVNVIANMQQQNHRFLFDVPNNRVGVARETCS